SGLRSHMCRTLQSSFLPLLLVVVGVTQNALDVSHCPPIFDGGNHLYLLWLISNTTKGPTTSGFLQLFRTAAKFLRIGCRFAHRSNPPALRIRSRRARLHGQC